MKTVFGFLLASSISLLVGCAAARVYPLKGPLSTTVPTPIYEAKMSNLGSSGNFSTEINGERFAARWHQVPRRHDPTSKAGVAVDPPNLSAEWEQNRHAWTPVVPEELYLEAQRKFAEQTYYKPNKQILEQLDSLLREKGLLSERLVYESAGLPSNAAFRRRFGSLTEASLRLGIRHLDFIPSYRVATHERFETVC